MSQTISKKALRERLGIQTDAELARFFGISRSAVYQWPEDEELPELRVLQAFRKRPDAFPEFLAGAANDAGQPQAAPGVGHG